MVNKHIKVINGRKYYYQSIRIGKRVTSKYLGPVQRVRKARRKFIDGGVMLTSQPQEQKDETQSEDSYIG